MPNLKKYLPDSRLVLELPPEDLAGYVLLLINSEREVNIPVQNYGGAVARSYSDDSANQRCITMAVTEALAWLISEGLIIPSPGQSSASIYTLSRKGALIQDERDVEDLRKRALLPKAFLHPAIESSAYPMFLGGHYDGAVFQAFKEVEIAVRNSTGIEADGVKLMEAAFRPANARDNNPVPAGPLTDPSLPDNEQQGLSSLFRAAVLWCRNPVGHKNVGLGVKDASRLLVHASYLMELIDNVGCVRGRNGCASGREKPAEPN
jgi:uncharacterized protein (TIGR02391 family)